MQTKNQETAPQTEQAPPTVGAGLGAHCLESAQLIGQGDSQYLAAFANGEVRTARKADGCLLLPEQGDLVLAARPERGCCWIVTVLQKQGPAREIVLGSGASLRAEGGALRMRGRSLELAAGEQASLTAADLTMGARRGRAIFEAFNFLSEDAHARLGRAKILARSLQSSVGRLVQRLGNCFRRVRSMDQTIAGSLSCSVEGRLSHRCRHAAIHAEQRVSINGESIDVG